MIKEVVVPDIGEYKNVDVIEVFVKVGDAIHAEASLISLETDKATMEIPAPFAGTVKEILVKVGDKVSEGTLIFRVESSDTGSVASGSVSTAGSGASTPSSSTASAAQTSEVSLGKGSDISASVISDSAPVSQQAPAATAFHATPVVRRLARELGISLDQVSATGPKGRLTKDDLLKYIQSKLASSGTSVNAGAGLNIIPDPVVDFAKFGPIESQPLSRIKKLSGANLYRNWVKIPHITLFEDADITALEEFRSAKKSAAEKVGVKLTPVPFIVKAVAKALLDFPEINASLSPEGDALILKKYVHIGVAVDTPNGLVVPVIQNADQKGVYDIARELTELAKKAREGKLKPTEMQGGCFTISSLGGIGTHGFTPIVNMPEVAILGISKAAIKPIYQGETFVPRLMLPLSLSVDHRVIDGAQAGGFVVRVASYLSDLRELLL